MSFELRHIRDDEYGVARDLWDTVFPEDAGGFSAYYFEERSKPHNVFAAFDGGRMVGDLHAIPYALRFGKTVKPCVMVAGVATLPEYRHKGIAGSLIRMAHEKLQEEGVAAALLKPDVDFYAQFGYLSFAYHNEYILTAKQATPMKKSALYEPDAAQMLGIYDAFARHFAGMMDRTVQDMTLYLKEARLSGFTVTDGQSYALCVEDDGGVEVSELAGPSPLPLLAELAERFGKVHFRIPASVTLTDIEPTLCMMFSMLCPLNEAKLLDGTGAESLKSLLAGEIGPCCTLEFC